MSDFLIIAWDGALYYGGLYGQVPGGALELAPAIGWPLVGVFGTFSLTGEFGG